MYTPEEYEARRAAKSEIYFAEAIRQPRRVPDNLLFELTRDLHSRSAHSDDRSPNHQWYYRLACECERRGHDLTQILKG